MIKFIKLPNPQNRHDLSEIEFTLPDEMSHDKVVEYFNDFLRACGYRYEGEYELVEPNEVQNEIED